MPRDLLSVSRELKSMAEAGLRWHVTEPFALRLGYTHYDFEREADGAAQLLAEWHF